MTARSCLLAVVGNCLLATGPPPRRRHDASRSSYQIRTASATSAVCKHLPNQHSCTPPVRLLEGTCAANLYVNRPHVCPHLFDIFAALPTCSTRLVRPTPQEWRVMVKVPDHLVYLESSSSAESVIAHLRSLVWRIRYRPSRACRPLLPDRCPPTRMSPAPQYRSQASRWRNKIARIVLGKLDTAVAERW